MNGLVIGGIALNSLVVFAVAVTGEYPAALVAIMAGCVALSASGALLVGAGRRRPGAILVMIGCVAFIPLGLVGAWGARQVLDQMAHEEFEKRRAALKKKEE